MLKLNAWRETLRLYSGLYLAFFILLHLLNHAVGLISLSAMDTLNPFFLAPFDNPIGGPLLIAALTFHLFNGLYAIYQRTSLRMRLWEAAQILLGLLVPLFLSPHLASVLFGQLATELEPSYELVVAYHWIVSPVEGAILGLGLLTAWAHGAIGMHYWLRLKEGYARWESPFLAFVVAVPVAAIGGYISAGVETIRLAEDPGFLPMVFGKVAISETDTTILRWLDLLSLWVAAGLVSLPFAAAGVRAQLERFKKRPIVTLADGQKLRVVGDATALETMRRYGIPHAAVCGGRGRCTTCRVRVLSGGQSLANPNAIERKALDRIEAPEGLRLACQIRPRTDVSLLPLLPPRASASDGQSAGGLEGQEVAVTIMFIDLRGSTKLGETKLPYDVLFILNQFFAEMTKALMETNGHYAQFNGDGLMAIYGLNSKDHQEGARSALRGAARMFARLEELNEVLASELPFPLEMGIGINHGEAIVGAMGPPERQLITAIGDSVNSAARLESLCKEQKVPLIVSVEAMKVAGYNPGAQHIRGVTLRGRHEETRFYALPDANPETFNV